VRYAGTDLRIFRSLTPDVIDSVLAADFEPGIIDAYLGEDKLPSADGLHGFAAFLGIRHGHQGLATPCHDAAQMLSALQQRQPGSFLKTAPGWCEISYLNDCEKPGFGEREISLAWIFASLKGHHGFALQLARTGHPNFAVHSSTRWSETRDGESQ
jgi:hypothetical protein